MKKETKMKTLFSEATKEDINKIFDEAFSRMAKE